MIPQASFTSSGRKHSISTTNISHGSAVLTARSANIRVATTSTAFQLAVDHAFTGSYARRCRPADPPGSLICPCGLPLRTPTHLVYSHHYQPRVDHAIHTHGICNAVRRSEAFGGIQNRSVGDRSSTTSNTFRFTDGRTLTLTQLHSSVHRSHQLLSFIAESRVAMRPPDIGPPDAIPPEPD
jgi:hypothetical protein